MAGKNRTQDIAMVKQKTGYDNNAVFLPAIIGLVGVIMLKKLRLLLNSN